MIFKYIAIKPATPSLKSGIGIRIIAQIVSLIFIFSCSTKFASLIKASYRRIRPRKLNPTLVGIETSLNSRRESSGTLRTFKMLVIIKKQPIIYTGKSPYEIPNCEVIKHPRHPPSPDQKTFPFIICL